ncbi:bifunctional glycosyltransferase family 2/GtrA family protein [Nonomuraea africana]|uniref:dolichyl-phosphate beta-glucosyltransferase n=1 Tax=Nonomuraea africana TaxID=46171 RepID=A0ABR9K7B8_9ACTN|nr:bifunctional glycosyltransferase family 2/GtrA family protein [Nonomuraea africana]MBE1557903.1 putative flippase GtrA [Nonomuraea africana]
MTSTVEGVPFVADGATRVTTVDVIIPVLNEERALPGCVETVHRFLSESFPLPWRITIVDNGSTDGTWELATGLSRRLTGVAVIRVETSGKGAAVKAGWTASRADVVAFMDVDLSTGLHALLPLVMAVASGHCEVAIGSRLLGGARIRRSFRREVISRAYNGLLRVGFRAGFTDSACGFKAARAEVIRPILGKVVDDGWFFDTEMLLIAEHNGARVREVAVDWVEDADSKVDLWRTAVSDLRGLVRVSRAISSGAAAVEIPHVPGLAPERPRPTRERPGVEQLRKMIMFGLVGLASTVVHAGLYLLLRAGLPAEVANLFALAATVVVNTEANRRWTFNRGAARRAVVHARAGLLFLLNFAVTTAAIVVVGAGVRWLEGLALVGASIAVTVIRFTLLDRWVFRR